VKLEDLVSSPNLEVQERASTALQVFTLTRENSRYILKLEKTPSIYLN